MRKKVGILADDRFLDHRIDQNVLECPERLRNIYLRLKQPGREEHFRFYSPRSASASELEAVHSSLYVDQIRNYCLHDDSFAYDQDTYLMEDSFYTAELAAGGGLVLCDALLAGEIDQGFALVRPPGHHAETGRGMGFCIFNNIAIAANYLKTRHGLQRILIFDFDAHHGNGAQNIFYNDDQVLLISIHQSNLFPKNSGGISELGAGAGVGYNINIPVYPFFGDLEYNYLLGKVVQEIISQYMPRIILVSAGFDGHGKETISELNLSTDWYGQVTETLKYFAREYCENRLLYFLEGGYNSAILETSVFNTLKALLAEPPKTIGFPFSPRASELLTRELIPSLGGKWALE